MNRSTVLLVATLAANAALIAVFVSRSPGDSPAAKAPSGGSGTASAPASASASTATPATPAARGPAGGTPGRDARPTPESLAAFFGGDLRGLVDRLRAAGYPPDFIASVVSSQLYAEYEAKFKALPGYGVTLPFWQTGSGGSLVSSLTSDPAFRELDRELGMTMQELLGADYYGDEVTRRRQFGDLPMEKVTALQAIMRDYQMRMSAASAGGLMLAEDREQYDQIQRERREAIVKALTPEELFQYDLRTSSTAAQLRSQLQGFEPSEEEYLTIFKLRQAFDEKWQTGMALNMTVEQSRARQAEQLQLEQDIAAALTPERAADYKLLADNSYRNVRVLTDKLQLPPAAAAETVAIQKDIQARLTTVRTTVPPAERNQALAELAEEASSRIAGVLGGPRGLTAYRQNSTGSWMINIVPPPPMPRPAPPPAAR